MEPNRDLDPLETQEWLDALRAVQQYQGAERANFLVDQLVQAARREGIYIPASLTTAYRNTIPVDKEERTPGIRDIEHKIRSAIRWNAMAIILRANKKSSELGGHIASFQSSALLYDIGFRHFWHAPSEDHGGDLIYFQGHFAPGHLRPGLSRRPFNRGTTAQFPSGNRRQGPVVLSASVADA